MRPRITYFKYFYYFIRCGSLKRYYNYLLNRIEKQLKRVQLKSLPINISIEPCNLCNLKCPGCITGVHHTDSIQPAMLTFEQFKRIFDQFKDYVFNISLYNWGEPFLNKDIFPMAEYATSNRCAVTVHSNFNIFDEAMAEKAILSRLTHIYFSIDGATQGTYEKYRRGGDLSRVLRNIELLVSKKREMKSKFPIVTWKYLIFPYNIGEIELARRMSNKLHLDAFELFHANLDNLGTFGSEEIYDLSSGRTVNHTRDFCDALWDSMVVYPDGSAVPCCQSFRKKDIFGNVFQNPIREVWNNSRYIKARRSLATKTIEEGLGHPCCECKIIENIKEKR